jgi:putative peptidoglycan lipid II flippase
MHDTRTPVVAGIGIIILNIVMGLILLDHMGFVALALALSASTTVEAAILLVVLRGRLGSVLEGAGSWLARVLAATAVTAAVAALFAPILTETTIPGNGSRLLQAILFVAVLSVVGVVYLGIAWILRIPELFEVLDQLSRRIPILARFSAMTRR